MISQWPQEDYITETLKDDLEGEESQETDLVGEDAHADLSKKDDSLHERILQVPVPKPTGLAALTTKELEQQISDFEHLAPEVVPPSDECECVESSGDEGQDPHEFHRFSDAALLERITELESGIPFSARLNLTFV